MPRITPPPPIGRSPGSPETRRPESDHLGRAAVLPSSRAQTRLHAHTKVPGMTPATSPGTGVAGTQAEGGAGGRGARALLIAGGIVAAVAAVAYLAALATHPWKSLLNGFDLQVYLGGAHEALHHAGRLYTWHYRSDLGIQFTYTPFAALLFAAGLAVPFKALMGLVSLASTVALAATAWIAFRELGWRSMASRAGATLLVSGL